MNTEKLLRVADILENVPSENFNLLTWYQKFSNGRIIACAVGWAAQNEWFIQRGFKLSSPYQFDSGKERAFPIYKSKIGAPSICEFFEINEWTAQYLFAAINYKSYNNPLLVVDKIRAEVAAHLTNNV